MSETEMAIPVSLHDRPAAMSLKETINYHIVPPVFLIFFTAAAQYLAAAGNPNNPFETWYLIGNPFAWKVIGSMTAWAFIWLWIPSKKFAGPTTSFGYTPIYQANGELYYAASVGTLLALLYVKPSLSVSIYENMGPILGGLNVVALSLCWALLIKGKIDKNSKDPYLRSSKYPILHEFYRGMELHPRVLGVDIKQLTNCRIGMMAWQLLIIIYLVAGYQLHGLDYGHVVNVALQSIYIYKFFHWETGYFNTLDITLDRAGYYLCWGCLVWIESFYTFSSYFFVYHVPKISFSTAALIFAAGLAAIYFNYDVDRQKELFRTANGKKVQIWGKQAKGIKVSYTTAKGDKKNSELMTSGWWGLARKINYTFELSAALTWSLPGFWQFGIWPYLYFVFLAILLVHRIFRDEEKCYDKYGQGWKQYCKAVSYRLIPYVF